MNRDPGDIPVRSAGRIDLVQALSLARDLPVEALERASEEPARIAPAVLSVVAKAGSGETLSERDRNLLFWGVFVLGHTRDLRLFQPLIRLLARPGDELDALFGDAVVEVMPRLAASVFDGDAAALQRLLADPAADEGVRMALFGTLAFLTWSGRIPLDDTRAFLLRFDEERPVRAGDVGWHGWEAAIGLLGFSDLLPRVAAAHADARLLGVMAGPDWCAETVARAEAGPSDPARFEEEALGLAGHPIDEFEHLTASPDDDAPATEPVRNALREVGRNDPCPCGSGRKFKKCCLGKAA